METSSKKTTMYKPEVVYILAEITGEENGSVKLGKAIKVNTADAARGMHDYMTGDGKKVHISKVINRRVDRTEIEARPAKPRKPKETAAAGGKSSKK